MEGAIRRSSPGQEVVHPEGTGSNASKSDPSKRLGKLGRLARPGSKVVESCDRQKKNKNLGTLSQGEVQGQVPRATRVTDESKS